MGRATPPDGGLKLDAGLVIVVPGMKLVPRSSRNPSSARHKVAAKQAEIRRIPQKSGYLDVYSGQVAKQEWGMRALEGMCEKAPSSILVVPP
jgi:hypothetical protein